MYETLPVTPERLEKYEDVEVDIGKIDWKVDHLTAEVGEVFKSQRMDLTNCITKEKDQSPGRDYVLLEKIERVQQEQEHMKEVIDGYVR